MSDGFEFSCPRCNVRNRVPEAPGGLKCGRCGVDLVGALNERLRSPRVEVRCDAARAMGVLGHRAAAGGLLRALHDPVADVRTEAWCALFGERSEKGPSRLSSTMDEDLYEQASREAQDTQEGRRRLPNRWDPNREATTNLRRSLPCPRAGMLRTTSLEGRDRALRRSTGPNASPRRDRQLRDRACPGRGSPRSQTGETSVRGPYL